MAEVAGLAIGVVGVLPVIVQGVVGYRKIRTLLAQVRACSNELRTLEIDVEVQEGRFLNEWELVLHSADINDDKPKGQTVRAMIEDPNHSMWRDSELDDRLRQCLERSYDVCAKIIDNIVETLQDIQQGLGESLRKAFRRLQQSFQITFDKQWYEKKLDRLRSSNQDLGALRTQIYSFQNSRTQVNNREKRKLALPEVIKKVRDISEEAHRAICNAFSCDDRSHTDHAAAMGVKASVEDTPAGKLIFEMAIDFAAPHPLEPSVAFLLQSCYSKSVEKQSISAPPASSSGHGSLHTLVPALQRRDKHGESSKSMACQSRTFEDSVTRDCHALDLEESLNSSDIDLVNIDNACKYLQSKLGPSTSLDDISIFCNSPANRNYCFYFKQNRLWQPNSDPLLSLNKLLQDSRVEPTLDQQAKMALQMSLAVLQFHSTPWLEGTWKTSDVFVHSPSVLDSSESLLFLRAPLSEPSPKSTLTSSRPYAENYPTTLASSYIFSMADYYGINNMTLFGLGVALIEIGHWRPLAKLRRSQDPDDILTARRLANQTTLMGKEYQYITQMCLQCNFGCSTDLGQASLQTAVYNNVVQPLQKLVKRLEAIAF
ncbi:hypothetical protein FPRO06_11936 [Fusarium proliferatum]|nr:hypothetical protein FPRO06_11936 [Fusarium proliferatum]